MGEANDLKRTPDALAKEMGLELNFVNGIIAGKQNLENHGWVENSPKINTNSAKPLKTSL